MQEALQAVYGMSAYLSVDAEQCLRRGHSFYTAGSDKTPLKLNLICQTCTDANPGKTAYAAYGTDAGSFGQWTARKRITSDDERRIDSGE
jgi:hypothetical protein